MAIVEVNRVGIHYEDEGRGEPIVLIHGLGGCAENWAGQAKALAPHYRVIRIDLRGFGKSECPPGEEDYSVALFAEDLLCLINHLKLGKVHLVGTSMGGYVAQWFALHHQDRLLSLVLCHTACKRGVPPELLEKRIQALEASDMKTYAAQIVGQALAAGSPEELVATLVDSVSRNSKNAYRKVITTGLAGFDLCRSLSQIHVPTLVIGGEHDRVIPPEQAVDLHRRIPGSKYVVIRGVGHLSYFEDPGAFNAALADFLRNLPGA